MSRASTSSQRSLTLTEELEKLEQSITLTLQEIDHNFSRAHRIVTTSILPIVEQYAEHSRDVWEGAKFWKQFFEASANVSLSGYEEQPDNEDVEKTITEDSTATTHTTLEEQESESYATPSSEHIDLGHDDEDIDLSSLTVSPSHSTPRANATSKTSKRDPTTAFADYPSPYEALRQEVESTSSPPDLNPGPSTPGKTSSAIQGSSKNIAMTPGSSPFLSPAPASLARPSTAKKRQHTADPLLHRVLDRNYRVQATPLITTRSRAGADTRGTATTTTPATTTKQSRYAIDSSPLSSSPEIQAPQLHAEIFSSPLRTAARSPHKQQQRTPKPGVSVLTPAKKALATRTSQRGIWDSDDELDDDDDDDEGGMPYGASPPKTMQFHVPQSRLLRTPAKEASKRIVSDLLLTAGGGDLTDENLGDGGEDESSPSVVRRGQGLEDESF